MAIKPIEFQVMIPKTQEVSKIHSNQIQNNAAFQQQQALSVQRKAENDVRQVHTQDNVHRGTVQEKQERNKREEERNKREQKKSENPGKSSNKPHIPGESIIDIRI